MTLSLTITKSEVTDPPPQLPRLCLRTQILPQTLLVQFLEKKTIFNKSCDEQDKNLSSVLCLDKTSLTEFSFSQNTSDCFVTFFLKMPQSLLYRVSQKKPADFCFCFLRL